MSHDLLNVMVELRDDSAIRSVVLTGEGPAFHAGGDVKAFVSAGDDITNFVDRLVGVFHGFISKMVRLPKPVIAAVNGTAAGAGFSIAMACDLVLAREDAVFTAAYSRIGATPDGSMTYFLTRQLGSRRAMELYLTNRVLTAQEAREWGLVTEVLPENGFMDAVMDRARMIASGPTMAYGRAKDLFYHSFNNQLETQLELEGVMIREATRTEDFREGTRAFVEKRPANFSGK